MFDIYKINTFLLSMLPIGELRFSIPIGIYNNGLPWDEAFLYSIFGNSFIALILIFMINYYKIKRIKYFISQIPLIGFIFKKWEKSSIKKSKKIHKWGYTGLILFVGLPLPVTGAWTAVLISVLLDLKPVKSFFSIIFGLMISGAIVTFISVKAPHLLEYIFVTIKNMN